MRRTILFLILFIPCLVNAITEEELKNIAISKLGKDRLEIKKTTSDFSVVQSSDGSGFVIIDFRGNRKGQIIAFSTEGNWEEDSMPPIVHTWLHKLESGYNIEMSNSLSVDPNRLSISPLLTCHWHQNSPYNDLSPIIEDGDVKTAAGCVSIAAAQIAYYWRKDNPLYTLKDTPTYIYGGAPVSQSIPKGTPNNWELMLDMYSSSDSQESRYAAAQLCYVIGTTSYLNYASSTGGSIRDAANAMFSQYNLLSEYVSKQKKTYSEWIDILYDNLTKGYPVMCSGIGSGGHAFVLDGYDSETGLFHFNFGWGGSGDGYYPVDDSEYSMGGFSLGQSIVYDIHPSTRNIEASLNCADYNSESINVISTIRNNSTLPIRQLYIYAVPENSTLKEAESPIWEGVGINNDGIEYSIPVVLNISKNKIIKLFLTDENKYELAHYYINIDNSINNIIHEERNNCIYDLTGKKVFNFKKGIYVIDNGFRKTKVILK